jgi:hypothetical protein
MLSDILAINEVAIKCYFTRESGMVAHICNLHYVGGRYRRIVVRGQFRQKVSKTPPQPRYGSYLQSQLLSKQR